MSSEVLEHLKHLSNAERLQVIETATQLIRDDLVRPTPSVRDEQDNRLRAAALAVRDLYDAGELTDWTSLDSEDFLDDTVQK